MVFTRILPVAITFGVINVLSLVGHISKPWCEPMELPYREINAKTFLCNLELMRCVSMSQEAEDHAQIDDCLITKINQELRP